jgi:hypothetical protein
LGLLNPLVLVHFVGGAHNDALMVGLTVAGFALAASGRENAGIIAVALGLLVKAPALLALVFLVPLIAAAGSPRKTAAATVRVAVVAAATVVSVTVLVGLGYGWLHALDTPTKVRNGLSISTDVGLLIGYPMKWLGVATLDGVVGACRAVGLAAALAAIAVAVLRARRLGPLYALGLALTALVVLGPILHPWYLLWGFVPLALSAPDGPVRRLVVVASAGGAFLLMPDGERRPTEMIAGAVGVVLAVGLLRLISQAPGPSVGANPERLISQAPGPPVGANPERLISQAPGPPVGANPERLDRPGRDVMQRETVPVDPEPADDAGGDGGHDRVVPELLARVDVGDVHLDQRGAEQGTGVAQRVRIV